MNAMPVAEATLETLLLAQAFRPLSEQAGAVGEYAVETFAQTIVASMERNHG